MEHEERHEHTEATRLASLFEGRNKAAFAREHNVPGGASMISQHISGIRPISLEAAVAYARGFGVPIEAISPRLSALIDSLPSGQHGAHDEESPSGFIIHQWETGGRMGSVGIVLQEQPGIIKSWHVSDEWLQKNVHRITSPKNLSIVTGFGDSMRPMFNSGDPLLVDTGRRVVNVDGIYFFRIGDEGFIKRLQRIPQPGGATLLRAKSENPAYEPFDIVESMDFEVFGWVVKVWRGEDF